MQYGPNSIAQIGVGNYRVSANPLGMTRRINGVTFDFSTVPAIGGRNAKGTLVVTAGSGNVTYTYGGQTTGNVAYNATADTIEAALEGLSTIGNGNIKIAGNAPNFTYELIGDLARTPRLAFSSTGATIASTQTGLADADVTLPGGVVAKVGERVLRAGSVIYKLDGGLYGLATGSTTLTRGECYVVDAHHFESIDLPYVGDVFDEGTVFRARLLVDGTYDDGTDQPSEDDFLDAFPGIRLIRD